MNNVVLEKEKLIEIMKKTYDAIKEQNKSGMTKSATISEIVKGVEEVLKNGNKKY